MKILSNVVDVTFFFSRYINYKRLSIKHIAKYKIVSSFYPKKKKKVSLAFSKYEAVGGSGKKKHLPTNKQM